jgi:hypothetical protein
VDPDARHTRKSPENRRDGYRAHVAACPETGIITGEQLTRASGEENSDAVIAAQFLAAHVAEGSPPCEWYCDSAYGTGTCGRRSARPGTAVIKPRPLKPAVEGGLTLDDFAVDEAAGTVTCPAGLTRRISARRNVTFGAACRGCPLRARCTTSKTGRALTLHEHDALLRAARAGWAASPGPREDYKKYRPSIERVISQIASRGGRRRKLRYLGTTRNNAWLKNRVAAATGCRHPRAAPATAPPPAPGPPATPAPPARPPPRTAPPPPRASLPFLRRAQNSPRHCQQRHICHFSPEHLPLPENSPAGAAGPSHAAARDPVA